LTIKISELRHIIKIQRKEFAPGHAKALRQETTYSKEVHAKIEPLKSHDLYRANEIWPGTDHRITIRYVEGVEQGMIITWNDKAFEITHVTDEDYKHQWLEIMCKEIPRTNQEIER
jgi:SPP1 family predicted phage head-tail adaptor